MRISRWFLPVILASRVGVGGAYSLLNYASEGMATLQVGMIELYPPNAPTVFLRRQADFGRPAELYLSSDSDYCSPFNRRRDLIINEPIHGGEDSPLLISYEDHVIVVHGPTAPKVPWSRPSFAVRFAPITLAEYALYASVQSTKPLPAGWIRVTVPYGHNTCVL